MEINERLLPIIKKRLNYTDEQFKTFLNLDITESVINKAKELANTVLVLTVVSSHGCNSMHQVGDKIYFDGAGNILTKYCPEKICTYALNNASMLIFAANEFIYSDMDPNKIKFKRCACYDSGINCGGFGQVIFELSTMSLEDLQNQ